MLSSDTNQSSNNDAASFLELFAGTEFSAGQMVQSPEAIREAVLQDMIDLLNSRPRCQAWPEEFKQLADSVLGYGMEDFSQYEFQSATQRNQIRNSIEQTLRRFESRVHDLQVDLLDYDPLTDCLEIQIAGTILPGAIALQTLLLFHRDRRVTSYDSKAI